MDHLCQLSTFRGETSDLYLSFDYIASWIYKIGEYPVGASRNTNKWSYEQTSRCLAIVMFRVLADVEIIFFYYARNQTRKNRNIEMILILTFFHVDKTYVEVPRKYCKFPVNTLQNPLFNRF